MAPKQDWCLRSKDYAGPSLGGTLRSQWYNWKDIDKDSTERAIHQPSGLIFTLSNGFQQILSVGHPMNSCWIPTPGVVLRMPSRSGKQMKEVWPSQHITWSTGPSRPETWHEHPSPFCVTLSLLPCPQSASFPTGISLIFIIRQWNVYNLRWLPDVFSMLWWHMHLQTQIVPASAL